MFGFLEISFYLCREKTLNNMAKKPNGYWQNVDNCIESVVSFLSDESIEEKDKTRHGFHVKYSHAEKTLREAGLLDYYFPRQRVTYGTWLDYGNCYNAALKCKTITEFHTVYCRAYDVSNEKGWLADFDWFENRSCFYVDGVDEVYAYMWVNLKIIYVGRTVDEAGRCYQHLHQENDTVFKAIKKYGKPVFVVLRKGVAIKEGLELEDFYRKQYVELGWTVINKAKTGITSGSVGSIGYHRITKKMVFERANECTTITEFIEKFPNLYQKASRKKWLNELCLTYNRACRSYWDIYENCKTEAAKYKGRAAFQKASGSAYNASKKNRDENGIRWIDIFFPVKRKKPDTKWNSFDNCKAEASKYENRTDFHHKSGSAYKASKRNKIDEDTLWIDVFFSKE